MLRQFTTLLALAVASLSAQAQSCTRESLKVLVANYLQAVETHSMSALPTTADLRITENGRQMRPGEGFFLSGGKALLQRSLFDTERCGSVTQAVTNETIAGAQTMAVMAVRLKAVQGKVSEIELLVTREAEMKNFYNPKVLLGTSGQDWTTPLPVTKRPTRQSMNLGANQYFDSFAKVPPAIPPFASPCHRWEGGMHATPDGNCLPKDLVLQHTHRRFPVTDLELGITAAFVNFATALPDVHIFKYNAEGRIEWIHAVFGGRETGPVWPDETK